MYTNPKTSRSETDAEIKFHRNLYWSDLSVPSLHRRANVTWQSRRELHHRIRVPTSVFRYYVTIQPDRIATNVRALCIRWNANIILYYYTLYSQVFDKIIYESPSGVCGVWFHIFLLFLIGNGPRMTIRSV